MGLVVVVGVGSRFWRHPVRESRLLCILLTYRFGYPRRPTRGTALRLVVPLGPAFFLGTSPPVVVGDHACGCGDGRVGGQRRFHDVDGRQPHPGQAGQLCGQRRRYPFALPPLIPGQTSERDGVTGPFKLDGGSRRHFVTLTDQLKQSFADMVIFERCAKLKLTRNEVLEGNIFSGVEATQVGLVDGLGGQTEAIEKAASLGGIANYDLVDVNTEVSRIFNQKLDRINGPLTFGSDASGGLGTAAFLSLVEAQKTGGSVTRRPSWKACLPPVPIPFVPCLPQAASERSLRMPYPTFP